MYRISGIKLPIAHSTIDVEHAVARRIGLKVSDLTGNYTIIKKSLDCRDKSNIRWVYSLNLYNVKPRNHDGLTSYVPSQYQPPLTSSIALQPVIVGSGPAGLMAAFALARTGLRPIVLERGKPVDERVRDVERFWTFGELDQNSNVQFGEGGAGTFSDGKLTTGINDPRMRFVLETFVNAGAPDEILYLSKPHIGTDRLRGMVKNLRKQIEDFGGEFRFNTKFVDFITNNERIQSVQVECNGSRYDIRCDHLILAIGHSARDTFEMLRTNNVAMTQKPFAIGVRIEHPQSMIDVAQYGRERGEHLPPADYKLAVHLPDGRGVYTFCMCPGGHVVAAASETGGVVTNGMSDYARDAANASSAVLVGVSTDDFGSSEVLAGVEFQRKIERAAFAAARSNYAAPAQTVGDFLGVRTAQSRVSASYKPGIYYTDLRSIFPSFVTQSIADALPLFDRKIRGFSDGGALMTAPETRSSSPVRIVRNERFQSSVEGIIPCGEGAGYAGGIVSAAVDGLRCAEAIIQQ